MEFVKSIVNKSHHQDALALIKAIESDFSDIDKVLIKVDWVMQNTLNALKAPQLTEEKTAMLIEQLSLAIMTVQAQLHPEHLLSDNTEKIVA
jgi:hypothetical protein